MKIGLENLFVDIGFKGLRTNGSYDSRAPTNLEWMGYEEFRLIA